GLLSRYLPTDTRPQARANLGREQIGHLARDASEIIRARQIILNNCRESDARVAYSVNGSTCLALRTNCTITARPHSISATSSTRAMVPPSSNRVATAHEAANAAPNTSAPIRMTALTTVSTLTQMIRRGGRVVASMGSLQKPLAGAMK